jgi:hypothetical protein
VHFLYVPEEQIYLLLPIQTEGWKVRNKTTVLQQSKIISEHKKESK